VRLPDNGLPPSSQIQTCRIWVALPPDPLTPYSGFVKQVPCRIFPLQYDSVCGVPSLSDHGSLPERQRATLPYLALIFLLSCAQAALSSSCLYLTLLTLSFILPAHTSKCEMVFASFPALFLGVFSSSPTHYPKDALFSPSPAGLSKTLVATLTPSPLLNFVPPSASARNGGSNGTLWVLPQPTNLAVSPYRPAFLCYLLFEIVVA